MPHDYPFPPDDPHADDVHALPEEACWARLDRSGLGRLAVIDSDGPDLFPVNYLVQAGRILFRSAPGRKIVSLTADPRVAFEADGIHDRARWSVVVRGTARRLNDEGEIVTSGVQQLHTASPTEKWNYFSITPVSITGVSFRSNPIRASGGWSSAV